MPSQSSEELRESSRVLYAISGVWWMGWLLLIVIFAWTNAIRGGMASETVFVATTTLVVWAVVGVILVVVAGQFERFAIKKRREEARLRFIGARLKDEE